MKPDSLREFFSDPAVGFDDIVGIAVGLGLWLLIQIAAPVIVLILAVLLFSVELPIVLAIAVLLLVARFAGVIPWTVVILNQVAGAERRESYRSLAQAVRRVRSVNAERRVIVRWTWA